MKKVTKLPRYLTPNFITACEEYCKETGKKEVQLGNFLSWLRKRGEKKMEKVKRNLSVEELERRVEVERAKIILLGSLSTGQWGAMAKLANEKYPSSHADKEKLLNKCLGE